MKNTKKLVLKSIGALSFIFIVGALLASCSKDKDGDDPNVINRDQFSRTFFDVGDSEFVGKPLPSSNTSAVEITAVTGNSTILAGGSNTLRILANEGSKEVIVGVKGEAGFFTVPMRSNAAPRGANALMEAAVHMFISQELRSGFTLAIGVGDGHGNFGQFEYMEVSLMNAGTGKLQVSVQWDQLNDVDLHLTEPNGDHIYYGRTRSANGGELDVDSNAACGLDYINNENITYAYPADDPDVVVENGEYHVELDLWSNCSIPENTSYTVIAHYDGVRIEPISGSNPSIGTFAPDDESQNSNRRSIMKFVIDGSGTKTLPGATTFETPKAVKFNVDRNNKVFKNFSVSTKE